MDGNREEPSLRNALIAFFTDKVKFRFDKSAGISSCAMSDSWTTVARGDCNSNDEVKKHSIKTKQSTCHNSEKKRQIIGGLNSDVNFAVEQQNSASAGCEGSQLSELIRQI